MTISSTTRKAGPFAGNGVATSFPFGFKVFAASDLQVTLTDPNGNDSTLTLDADYSVVLSSDQNNNPGGTIIYPVSGSLLAVGYKLTVLGGLAYLQPTDITNSGGFYPSIIEDALDRETILSQQLFEIASRSVRAGVSDARGGIVLPPALTRANTIFGFDALGNYTALPVTASIGAGDLHDEIGSDGNTGFVAGTDFIPGVTTQLTLSRPPGVKANMWIQFDAANQGGDQIQSLVGNVVTFTAPIPVGTQRVYVRTGTTLSQFIPPNDSVSDSQLAWGSLLQRVCDSITALQALVVPRYQRAFVTGYYAAGDGGGGPYAYDATVSQALANGGTIIPAAGGVGCWVLQYAGRLSAKQFGCKGDGTRSICGTGTDDTVKAQKYIDYCNAVGMTAWFPSGAYRFSSTLNVSNTGDTTFPQGRANIEGDGSQNTAFQWDNGAMTGLSVIGSIVGIASASMQTIRGISFIKADGTGTGIYLQSHAHLSVSDVWCLGWNEGMDLEDVQESDFKNLNFQFNVIGLHAARVTFTLPNVLTFEDCTFGNSKQGGMDLIDPTTLLFKGGSIESNNDLAGGPFTPIWGCRLTLSSPSVNEGTQVATFVGTYFERNGSATPGKGIGDVFLQNNVRDWGMTFLGCNFNRGTTFSTNNIGISSTTAGGARGKLTLNGNSFDAPALGGYPGPSASRPYWQIFGTDNVEVIDEGNYYQSPIEAPNYTGSVAMPQAGACAQARLGGWVRFNGTNGVITSRFGVATVTRTSTGTYTIGFANNQPNAGTRAYQSMLNNPGSCYLTSENAGVAVFVTANAAGGATDFTSVMISWAADPAA